MKKTPLGAACDAQLTAINDQLCFGAFSAEELNRVIVAQALPSDTLTPVAFPSNTHASRINRRLADLPDFEVRTTNTLCASALIAASEHMQAYYRAATDELTRLTGMAPPVVQGGDDVRLQAYLVALGASVTPEVFDTVIYLRQRRNRLVHLGPLNAWFLQFFASPTGGAAGLKAYWRGRPTKLSGFDFANRDLDQFTIKDGYAMMNLLRIGLNTIDSWVAAQLPIDLIAEEIAREVIATEPGLRNETPRLAKKTSALMKIRYCTTVTAAQIDASVRKARAI